MYGKLSITSSCALAAAVCFVVASPAAAKEQPLEFVHALQNKGYGELAVAYLEQLKQRRRLPADIAEVWDLEMSKSWRVAIPEAFNDKDAEDRLAKSQQHLDKFLKEYPNHAAAAEAISAWGDISLDRGLRELRLAERSQEKQEKEKHQAAARVAFGQARTRYAAAVEHYARIYQAVTDSKKDTRRPSPRSHSPHAKRTPAEEAKWNWLEARLKLALVDYHTVHTYPAGDKQRKDLLQSAAKAFDAVFQENRESRVGLYAHMQHGRCAEELGDDTLAMDLYDEVLASAPEPDEPRAREPDMEPLFAQVQYLRLKTMLRKQNPRVFAMEAADWLEQRKNWRQTEGYQGIAVELARHYLQEAEKATGNEKSKLRRDAQTLVTDASKTPGEHQSDAIVLLRRFQKPGATNAEPKTFDEAIAVGEGALEEKQWQQAIIAYEKALALGAKQKDKKRVEEVQRRYDVARYQLARDLYVEGKIDESLKKLGEIAAKPTSPVAPAAASLAVSASLTLYATAKDKKAALERLEQIANYTIKHWPGKAEGDEARIALAQACLVRGEFDEAIRQFEAMHEKSERYPMALHLAGQTHWRLYLMEKQKPQNAADPKKSQDPKKLVAERAAAEKQLEDSLQRQRAVAEAGKPMPKQLMDTQLLLAELRIEGGQFPQAAELLQPLVDSVKDSPPESLDSTILRVYVSAVRTYMAQKDLNQASGVAAALAKAGPDVPPVNGVLIAFARMLGEERKRANAEVIAANAGGSGSKATAEAELKKVDALLSSIIEQLAPRKNHSLAALVYLADTSAEIGTTTANVGKRELAGKLYDRILEQGKSDPMFGRVESRVRARRVGLLREEKKYDEALKQVGPLIEQNPNALEPLMEKGRILQDRAEADKKLFGDAQEKSLAEAEQKRLADAYERHLAETLQHWTGLRVRLASLRKKPPEYYEVIFNAAKCLENDSEKNPEKSTQAQQLLNATLVLSPKLNGPEMVVRYKLLLEKLKKPRATKPPAAQPLDASAKR